MTAFDVLGGAVPMVVAAGLTVIVILALSRGKDRAGAARVAVGCGLMAAVALVVVMGAFAAGQEPAPEDPDYTLSDGFLTVLEDVPAYSGDAPWRGSAVGLIVISEDVRSIGSGAFSGMDADVIFEGETTVEYGAFSHHFASVPAAGGYYMVRNDAYTLVPEVPDEAYVYDEDGESAVLKGVSESWARRAPFYVMRVPADSPGGLPVASIAPSGSLPAFSGARALFSDVPDLGDGAFDGCTALACMSVPSATTIGASAFNGCTALACMSVPSATTIGANAFYGCTALTSADLASATDIGNSAFYGCTALEFVNSPDVTRVGPNGFRSCSSLKAISLPDATTIQGYAFNYCTALESVDIPAAVSISGFAFRGCTAIQEVTLGPLTGTLSADAFSAWTFYASDGVTVLQKTAAALAGKTFRGTYAALIEVPEGEQSLSPEMLRKVADLTEDAGEPVLSPSSVTWDTTMGTQGSHGHLTIHCGQAGPAAGLERGDPVRVTIRRRE